MVSRRVPPTDAFGPQNAARERQERAVADALRLDASQYADLFARVEVLTAMQRREYAQWETLGASVLAETAFAQVTITSPTGRIEVGYGGSANNGAAWFYYGVRTVSGVVVVDQAAVITSAARRVAVTGGASFAPSGYRTQPVDVPLNTPVVVTVYCNTASGIGASVIAFGASISARVVA
jgi:hypothetical protein